MIKTTVKEIINDVKAPLSVILQVTRKCNFSCSFCSEIDRMPDTSLKDLEKIKNNLYGTQRIFISGGEPLLRKDIIDVVDLFKDNFVVGVPTNASPSKTIASKLSGKINFINVGLEGPRNVTNKVRGDYDQIMTGIHTFKDVGIPISLTAVIMKSTVEGLKYTCQIADVLEAGKLKLIMPILKGNALNMPESEFISNDDAELLYSSLISEKEKFGWKTPIRMVTWKPENEGYSILMYPNGDTYSWPVYNTKDKVGFLGNLKDITIQEIWEKYPYKENHVSKYVGKSIKII